MGCTALVTFVCPVRCPLGAAYTCITLQKVSPSNTTHFQCVPCGVLVYGEWCLLFYILATPKVISGWEPTCDSVEAREFDCRPN